MDFPIALYISVTVMTLWVPQVLPILVGKIPLLPLVYLGVPRWGKSYHAFVIIPLMWQVLMEVELVEYICHHHYAERHIMSAMLSPKNV
ncbi:hypothetical protein AR325_25630 (plasmid) [Serratia marcescens]|nr:hypothetical protein AR325_25630 [Serratia marcescens]